MYVDLAEFTADYLTRDDLPRSRTARARAIAAEWCKYNPALADLSASKFFAVRVQTARQAERILRAQRIRRIAQTNPTHLCRHIRY